MKSNSARLDRFISQRTGIHRDDVKVWLARGRILVDGKVATEGKQIINQFSEVVVDDQCLQKNIPIYIMMNKPAGVVSATKDNTHQTVINLIEETEKHSLHIVGRLDFNSTGLLLLTNDGRWSREINSPNKGIEKIYLVGLEKPLNSDYVAAFASGMYFSHENIHTRPAKLRILSDYLAEVSLCEGRYHQIKRMFGRFQNRVISLHRIAVGNIHLDEYLQPGEYRNLTTMEIDNITPAS